MKYNVRYKIFIKKIYYRPTLIFLAMLVETQH